MYSVVFLGGHHAGSCGSTPTFSPAPSHRRKVNLLCFLTLTRDHKPSELGSLFLLRLMMLGEGLGQCQGCPKVVSAQILPPAPTLPSPGRAGCWHHCTGLWLTALHCRKTRLGPAQHPHISPSLAAGAVIQFSSRLLHTVPGGGQTHVLDDTLGSFMTSKSHL